MKELLVTGAAGFIGRAACARFKDQYRILAIDDLSRKTARPPEGVLFIKGDCARDLPHQIQGIDIILHLAAQVSVTESLYSPSADFRNNAQVTMNLALRASKCNPPPIFIYASTNKVYGELAGVKQPISDLVPIRPQTPYGISKATGGLYVRDLLYETGYDFRQSCIYGEDQIGTIDQGWIGYLRRQIAQRSWITCYGDGKQVRDLLHVNDLLNAYEMAMDGTLGPGSYTIGGGEKNAVTFEEAVTLLGGKINSYGDWRPHDQKYFCSANDGLRLAGWNPHVDAREWLQKNRPKDGGSPPEFQWKGHLVEHPK